MEIKEPKSESGYIRVERRMLHSNYWKNILTLFDRSVLMELFLSIPTTTKFYKKGVLVSYKKIDNIVKELGIAASKSSVKRAIEHLSELGVIIKIKSGIKTNNAYILGLNVVSERYYLIDYLIRKHDKKIYQGINEKEVSLTNDQKDFIVSNIDNNLPFLKVKSGLSLAEEMFAVDPNTGRKKTEYLKIVRTVDGGD